MHLVMHLYQGTRGATMDRRCLAEANGQTSVMEQVTSKKASRQAKTISLINAGSTSKTQQLNLEKIRHRSSCQNLSLWTTEISEIGMPGNP